MHDHIAQYGIIGYPVKHSLSPLMHNMAFKELNVEAVYKLFPLKDEEVEVFFEDLRKSDCPIFGLNVTVPYKEIVLQYLDSITPFAQKVGAVNTIVITPERKLIGYNTDAPGFMSHLTELGFQTVNKRIAILGAGGSARAILATLCLIPERPQSIRIYNRTRGRLDALL
jgi:shikimate dehydrogenase